MTFATRACLTLALALGAVLPVHGSQLFEQLKAEYLAKEGVELVAGDETFPVTITGGQIAGKNVFSSEIDLYLYVFRKELGKYPKELFALIQLKRVVFCRELAVDTQPRAAVADWEHNTLYVEVRNGIYADSHRRKMIHHELFHLLDFADDGVLGRDPDWVALNPPEVFYGAGGEQKLDEKSTAITHPSPGFVSKYALASVAEDKAEVFANLMVYDVKIQLLLKQDSILAGKVQLLKQELLAFCPQVDEPFWVRAAKF